MKKLITLLFVAGLFFSVKTFAQTEAKVLWDLGSTTNATITEM